MRAKIVAGNWKMNTTPEEGIQLVNDILFGLTSDVLGDTRVIVSPPATHLSDVVEALWDSPEISVAAQNCHHLESGAYTGEISAAMLRSLEVDAVIIGHSERRQYFGETNEQLAAKVDIALRNELSPIYCCGELLEEREANQHYDVVKTQVQEALFHLSAEDITEVVIAYEPVWAIGTGLTASPEQAQEMHAHIRSVIAEKYGQSLANEISILYGGSCKPSNAAEIFSKPDVDGGLIGGASLVAADFLAIIKALK